MPYINTKTSIPISKDAEENIKTRLGRAVTLMGKSESHLMVNMEDNCRLYFAGTNDEPAAFVEVRLFGKASKKAYDDVTAEITKIIKEELAIPGNRIYVQYEEVPNWGFNGRNF